MKFNTTLALQLLEGLEKVTGKKVTLREWNEEDKAAYMAYKKDSGINDQDEEDLDTFDDNDTEILNEEGEAVAAPVHTSGERAALTRGDELNSPAQYALMYVIKNKMTYSLPGVLKQMDPKVLADKAGIKAGTYQKTGRAIDNYVNGNLSDPYQISPKGKKILDELMNSNKEAVLKLATKAFDAETVQAIMDKRAAQQKKPVQQAFKAPEGKVSINNLSAEQLANINAKRAARGEAPLNMKEAVQFVNRLVEGIQNITGKKIKFVESDSKKKINSLSEGFDIRDVRKQISDYDLKIKGARKRGDAQGVLGIQNELKSYLEDIGYQWQTDPNTAELIGESVDVELNEGILDFFSSDPVKKINKAVQKAIKIADDVNFYTNFYYFPEEWSRDGKEESEAVKRRIQNIWNILSKGLALQEATVVKGEKKNLNEWFAKSKYNNLLKTLDEIGRYAEKVVSAQKSSKSPRNAQELQGIKQEVLSNLKKVWQAFRKSKISDGPSFAGDDINKLSAKEKMKKATPNVKLNPGQQDSNAQIA